jgi:arginyl-tRNA--protein-N-Asp/Glu arginylyltransferase
MADGLSMVYSFFDPRLDDRSLGTFMILDHIAERARAAGLPHVYLGYWVNGSRKMDYKVRFLPQEHLGPKGWERFNGEPPRNRLPDWAVFTQHWPRLVRPTRCVDAERPDRSP